MTTSDATPSDAVLSGANQSEAEKIAALSDDDRAKKLLGKRKDWFERKEQDWSFWRRPAQSPPPGDWRVWMMMAGRGFGKTRAGAEWVRSQAELNGHLRIALVGASLGEVRQIMVEGESGLLAIARDNARPVFEASLRRLTWPNGAVATLYSAAEPESLRGPEHHIAWCDEIAKWDRAEACWDMLAMTLRLGEAPKIVVTTTPRAVAIVRRLMSEAGVTMTTGRTTENSAHLSGSWLDTMHGLYGGTRMGRQELNGEMIEDLEGALWSRELIERCRATAVPALKRIVIGVDPSASVGGDACGIVAVGLGEDGCAYVLGDHTVEHASPERWARAVAGAADTWGADRVIAEGNNGGAMVEAVLRSADVTMPVKRVHASRGKFARAEPVMALFAGGKAAFVGAFPALEDELCGLISGGGYEGPGRSPDRADACVWAMTELMLGAKERRVGVRVL
jgi:phage terminase large subunit-like protein